MSNMRGTIQRRQPRPDHPAAQPIVRRVPYAYDCGDCVATLYGETLWSKRFGSPVRAWSPCVYVGKMDAPEGAWVELQIFLDGEYDRSMRIVQGANTLRDGEFFIPANVRITLKVAAAKGDIQDPASIEGGIPLHDVTVSFEVTV